MKIRTSKMRLLFFAACFLFDGRIYSNGSQGNFSSFNRALGFEVCTISGMQGYVCRGSNHGILLEASGATFHFTKAQKKEKLHRADRQVRGSIEHDEIKMTLVGCDHRARSSSTGMLGAKSNYFIGNDPSRWRTDVPQFSRVLFDQVYPGVDLAYYGNQGRLEFDFVITAGTGIENIQWNIEGTKKILFQPDGSVVLQGKLGEIQVQRPMCYELDPRGKRRELSGRYIKKGANGIGYSVEGRDREHALIIDPIVNYSTYLGGSGFDDGYGVAVDSSGNAYVVGSTWGIPTTAGAFDTSFGGGATDAFVSKLNSTGTALIYSTYLGGNSDDEGRSIVVDTSGNAYVGGYTRQSFPTTAGAYQTVQASPGLNDFFVTKIAPAGNALVYSTYVGGPGDDSGGALAIDSAGNAFLTGYSSGGYPTTAGAYQTSTPGFSAVVTALNSTGTGLIYSTYLGGSGNCDGAAIAVDPAGNAYVAALAYGSIPTTGGAFQASFGGATDTFVTKLNATGSALLYSTLVGGSGSDEPEAIAIDGAGNAFVAGTCWSGGFPTTSGSFQTAYGGNYQDAYAFKLNAGGSALIYSTYLGGNQQDLGKGLALDPSGDAFVTGVTLGSFSVTAGAYQPTYQGNDEGFFCEIDPSGSSLIYSTYLGGPGDDWGRSIAMGPGGSIFVQGMAQAGFPTTAGAYKSAPGGIDLFVLKFDQFTPTCTPTVTPVFSPTISPTFSISPTPSQTFSQTPTFTHSPTFSASPTRTMSPSSTPSATPSSSCTVTPTCTPTPSISPSCTVSSTHSVSPTISATPTPSLTRTPDLSRFDGAELSILGIFPNPATANGTYFAFGDPQASAVTLSVYTVAGELVWRTSGDFSQGKHQVWWSPRNQAGLAVASGQYFLLVSAEKKSVGKWFSVMR